MASKATNQNDGPVGMYRGKRERAIVNTTRKCKSFVQSEQPSTWAEELKSVVDMCRFYTWIAKSGICRQLAFSRKKRPIMAVHIFLS